MKRTLPNLSIALFTASAIDRQVTTASGSESLQELLATEVSTVQTVKNLEELRYLEDVELKSFNAIVFAPNFGTTGEAQLEAITEIRNQGDLEDMPVLVISGGARSHFHSRLYEVGLDLLLPEFTPPEDIILALQGLLDRRRRRRSLLEQARTTLESETSIFETFSLAPQPILVLSEQGTVRWLNAAAYELLGLKGADDGRVTEYCRNLSSQFAALPELHADSWREGSSAPQPLSKPIALETAHGLQDLWDGKISRFLSPSGEVRGYALLLSAQMKNRFLQDRISRITQLESMALLSAASAHSNLQKTSNGIVVGPYRQIERLLGENSPQVTLNAVVTSLLEYLDPVTPPELSLRINIPEEAQAAVSFGDMFQLVGHMLFSLIGFVSGNGEILVEASSVSTAGGEEELRLTMSAHSVARAKMLPLLDLDSQREEKQYGEPNHAESGLQLSSRFDRIREITTRYHTELQYQSAGQESLKLRISLPTR
ncbi:hypothetical protein MRY87_07535 [bacterium]|nr:hypothetical protein [bacterium]